MDLKYLENNDIRIAAHIKGEGPLIVLIHGWPESWYSWRHQIPFLASIGYKVAAISVRGYGESSKPFEIEKYSILELASDIQAVIKGLGYEEAILVGHDWGAPIAWTAAIRYPNMIKAVAGLSVPYWSVGSKSQLDLWKELYKDKFFYQLYFLNEGVAEDELEKDIKKTIELTYFSSDFRGMKFLSENQNNPKYQKNKDSKFLDGLPSFDSYPSWISKKDIDIFVEEFTKSGMRGPLNRYRAQDIDFEELSEIGEKKIVQPSCFITGQYDPVNFMLDSSNSNGAFSAFSKIDTKEAFKLLFMEHYKDLRMLEIIDNIGHWTQEEAPKEVNNLLKIFIDGLN